MSHKMSYKVAALYQFASLPDHRDLRLPLRDFCRSLGLMGTILLAPEGINGTVAGSPDGIDKMVDFLRTGPLFGGRLDHMELKFSSAAEMPFRRMKVRTKREIITFGDTGFDPTKVTGIRVAPEDWNDLISAPDVMLIDTRNHFEVELGTFDQAVDPNIVSFSQFRDYAARELNPQSNKRIAMFCTGGIRCEKASAYLMSQGFENVYQLDGGILKYLETVPKEDSRWQGTCFVFDGRVALDHGLEENAPKVNDE